MAKDDNDVESGGHRDDAASDGNGLDAEGAQENIDTGIGVRGYVYGHHKSSASFFASQQQGCAMCNRFPGTHPENPKIKNLGYFSVFAVYFIESGETPFIKSETPIMEVSVGDISAGFEFVPYGDPKYDEGMNFDFGSSNHDSKAWSIIDTWMSTCIRSHPLCNSPKTPTHYRPTRLLKLDTPHTFRLVHRIECPPILQYVALSHCWGKGPAEHMLRLLQSTVNNLSQEQPTSNLPKTFRDAVEIAQHFGVDYIWIDRLCIYQDSAEDWKREAATMQDVYRNALLSISALGARDDQGGCFFERDPTMIAPTIVRFKPTENGEEKAFRFAREKGESWLLSFVDEPLVQRSWTVQERLLAPRTLHFGSKQVFWECREASCCEMHPQGVYTSDLHWTDRSEEANEPNHPFLWKQLLDAPDRSLEEDPYEQLFIDWALMTGYYAGRKLTVASDKLVALSGLANNMKARLQQLKPGPHRYLAGFWEEKLMDTLVWSVRGPAKRSCQYRAPSWSWACLDGKVNAVYSCRSENTIPFTSMSSVEMMYSGEEDTGEVTGGVLALVGPCALANIFMDPDRHYWSENERSVQSIQGGDGRELYPKQGADFRVVFDTLDDLAEEALLLWVCAHHFHEEEWYGHGLVLALVEKDKYRRLGQASCYFHGKDDARDFSSGFPRRQIDII
ncbi:HET-domain-containing protein [Periconia macrospinosa]|uniref:HET-domain-containing protein n=1 Tax=Periconia macrospinosa TaxID=97972 RepID=A0A2V1D4S2_9PLEO|nr:HET-domain-containing protein [Periconia macrospinosa]